MKLHMDFKTIDRSVYDFIFLTSINNNLNKHLIKGRQSI